MEYDIEEIQKYHNEGHTWRNIKEKFNISIGRLNKLKKEGKFVSRSRSASLKIAYYKNNRKHSEETKKKISKARKTYLKNNPNKIHWRSKDKKISKPCEKFKHFLRKRNISFIEEFDPQVENRFFSVDIAMPDKMIILEINGGQHYNSSGNLKPYYQERHNLIKEKGWKIFEVHYSACYDEDKINEFIDQIESEQVINSFDYFTYIPKKKIKTKTICSCGKLMLKNSKSCKICSKRKQKIAWPEPSIMQKMVWEKSTVKISKELGVSDVAIAKFCKTHNINKPPRGYWAKVASLENMVG